MSTLSPNERQRRSRSNNDDPTVRLSKALSYVLRHGAKKEGISMRTDGYVLLNELVGCQSIINRCHKITTKFVKKHS